MRRHEHEEVVLGLFPLDGRHRVGHRVDQLDVEERRQADAALLEDRLDHLACRLDREGPIQRRQQGHAASVAEAAFAEVLLEHEHELDGRRRAFPGDAADADQDPAPEPAKLLAKALGILQGVEAERSLDEPQDAIVHQPRAGRDDE